MHVLHVVPTPSRNPLLLSTLRSSRTSYSVISLASEGPLEDDLARLGVAFRSLQLDGISARSIDALVRAVRALQPDVVEAHSLTPGLLGVLASRDPRWRPPVVNVRHHNLNHMLKPSLKGRAADRVIARWSAHTIAVSGAVKNTMIAQGSRPESVTVIRNALASRFLPAPRIMDPEASAFMPMARSPVRLLAVGRLDWQKDYPTLLRAVSMMNNLGVAVTLDVLGAGSKSETAALHRLCSDLGAASFVRFHGYVSDVHQWYRQSDIFVHAARDEACALVLLEALAAGIPIVATDVGGAREVLGHLWGLVPPQDPWALAEALRSAASALEGLNLKALGIAQAVDGDSAADDMSSQHLAVCRMVLAEPAA